MFYAAHKKTYRLEHLVLVPHRRSLGLSFVPPSYLCSDGSDGILDIPGTLARSGQCSRLLSQVHVVQLLHGITAVIPRTAL